jgi:hypothetical protein
MHFVKGYWMVLAVLLVSVLACDLTGSVPATAQPGGSSTGAAVASTEEAKAPAAESTAAKTTTTAFTGAMPGNPPAKIAYVDDISEKATNGANGAAGGDNYSENIYERPFNKDMTYRPDLDIASSTFSKDSDWFYVSIALADQNPANGKMSADYGVELDVNKDGRGEFVIWTVPEFTTEWTRVNAKIFGSTTNMVGGTNPTLSDAPGWSGATYDKLVFDGASDSVNNGAWVRLSSAANTLEIAFNPKLVGSPAEFLWGVWADDGVKDPAKFDYNDVIAKADAGSPYKSQADYPPKGIWAVDSTCRYWIGFTPSTKIPGSCMTEATATPKPTPTATKFLPPPAKSGITLAPPVHSRPPTPTTAVGIVCAQKNCGK